MKLFQFTVARKLWALVIGLLAGMLVVVAGSLALLVQSLRARRT